MNPTRYDFHIHTKYLRCANETMEVPAIIGRCAALGVKTLAITDHLNTLETLDLHRQIRRDIEALDTDLEVYFGVELNFMSCDGPFAFNEDVKREYGFQFAIGGIHATYVDRYDLDAIVAIQHRHHLKACEDPLLDVLVHPYWLSKGEFDRRGWTLPSNMRAVPESLTRELGQAARETGTAIEINAEANLCAPHLSKDLVSEYIDYLAILADEGVTFSVGSDAHDIRQLDDIREAWNVLERLHIPAERIFRPPGAPLFGGNRSKAGV